MISGLRYVAQVLTLPWRAGPGWRRAARTAPVLAVLAGMALYGYAPSASAEERLVASETDGLLSRAHHVGVGLRQVEAVYDSEIAPIERVLREYRDDARLARRIAVSLLQEAEAAGVPPRLLLAVLLVENPWIDPGARSMVGAQGLMQVMPLHAGNWRACAPRLAEVEANICHGAQIFASYLREEDGHLERALLRYNGCVNGTNTPNCGQYAQQVMRAVAIATGVE